MRNITPVVSLGVVALVLSVVIFVVFASNFIVSADMRISVEDLGQDYLTGLAWAIALSVLIMISPVRSCDRMPLLILWFLLVIAALGLRVVYEDYYAYLDVFKYFREAGQGGSIGLEFGRGTPTVIFLTRLHQQYWLDSFQAIKITWTFIGLLAIYFHYRAATMYLGYTAPKLLLVLGCFPGILFWSSQAGKDPISLFGIGLYVLGVVGYHRFRTLKFIMLVLVGMFIASSIRLWLGLILAAPLLVFIFYSQMSYLAKISLFVCAIMVFSLALSQFGERFSVVTADDLVATTESVSQSWAKGGSGQNIESGFSSLFDLVSFLPLGVVTALLRPFPGEVLTPFGMLAGFENLILIIFLMKSIRRTGARELADPIIIWAISMILIWASVYGFVSYQNLGSAVRFKLQILPLFWLTLLYLSRERTVSGAKNGG